MSGTSKIWFPADLGRENSTCFYMILTFLSIVKRWPRSTSNFYALIGQNLTREFMRKIYAASGNLFADSWSGQSFVSSYDVFNCLFLVAVQNEIQLLSRFFFIHGWFVYYSFVWEMHRLSKSLEIRVWMASFSKMSLLTCPCSRRKRVESLKRFWLHLMAFRSSLSTGKPELLLSLMCFFVSVS